MPKHKSGKSYRDIKHGQEIGYNTAMTEATLTLKYIKEDHYKKMSKKLERMLRKKNHEIEVLTLALEYMSQSNVNSKAFCIDRARANINKKE